MQDEALTGAIIAGGMRVHTILGPGFLESVYHNALVHELRKRGLRVEGKKWIEVRYDGMLIGKFEADVLVEDRILVENKAVRTLTDDHETQLVNYLTATGLDVGLLLNFGAPRLQFKRKTRLYQPKNSNGGKAIRQDGQDGQDGRMKADNNG